MCLIEKLIKISCRFFLNINIVQENMSKEKNVTTSLLKEFIRKSLNKNNPSINYVDIVSCLGKLFKLAGSFNNDMVNIMILRNENFLEN